MAGPTRGRTTFYNGIRMRSRLEARFAAWMDHRQWKWRYEPHAFASQRGQYLPDFLVTAQGKRFYIDIKPGEQSITEGVLANGDIIRSSEPAARFGVVYPSLNAGLEHPSKLVQDQFGPGYLIPEWSAYDDRRGDVDLIEWIEGLRDDTIKVRDPARVWLPRTPEINALLAVIYEPAAITPYFLTDPWFTERLFDEPTNASAFRSLASTSTLHDAIDSAEPPAAELLLRLSVAELDGDPVDACCRVITEAVRREIRRLQEPLESGIHAALNDINEPGTRSQAAFILIAWLSERLQP